MTCIGIINLIKQNELENEVLDFLLSDRKIYMQNLETQDLYTEARCDFAFKQNKEVEQC